MQIITPSVTLWKCDDERLIERAGRVCYRSESDDPESYHQFIRSLIFRGHESVLEHCSATFEIICDRGISHELVRHRLASFSQESTRYVDLRDAAVIEPSGLTPPEARDLWQAATEAAIEAYSAIREAGCLRDAARSVLPTCLATRIVMTANFREWRHILKLRLSSAAHPDMRGIAGMIRDILAEHAPVTFGDFAR